MFAYYFLATVLKQIESKNFCLLVQAGSGGIELHMSYGGIADLIIFLIRSEGYRR